MIELFKQPNIDWMGKAKYFFVLSGILLLAGWTSIFFKGGLRYGIDFKGGTNVDVRFAQAPDIDRLRSGLAAQGLGNTEIQSARDIANPNSNEVLIFVEGRGQDEQTLQASREKVLSALNATYGLSGSNKADFNSATLSSLAAVLTAKDHLVLAVFHDVLITLGFFSLLHFEISLTVIAALLTLVGYSMNDTIVIFDRIRENNRLLRKESFADVVNKSINQTLSRTILTSGLTFLTVLVLFLMGGQVLRAFSFALVVGIVVGTYSSFGIAAPLVVAWNHWRGQGVAAGTGPAAGNKTRGGENVSGRLAPAGRR